MIDNPLTTCPECGEHIRRVLYPAGIVFKGAGFYKTDHRDGTTPVSKDSNGETKKTEDKGTTTSESQPAASSTPAKSTGDSKPSTAAATAD